MNAYFITGSNRELSRAELNTILDNPKTLIDSDDVFLIEGFEGNVSRVLHETGGSIKAGLMYASAKSRDELIQSLAGLAVSMRPGDGKLTFGVSVYEAGARGKTAVLRKDIEKIALSAKKIMRESGRSARYATSMTPVLSSVVVRKQGLLDAGIEFCLFPLENETLIGITETVQDFEEWGERDYGRPARDAARGMLPPKLARMMINLAGGDPEQHTILDPYCGVGTVLTEAMSLGYTRLIGSDIDEKATEATRKNVAWEAKRTEVSTEPQILHTSAEQISTFLAPKSVDVLVSEVYLGEPRKGDEERMVLERRMEKLVDMYTEGFRSLSSVIADGASVVMGFPVYKDGSRDVIAVVADKAKLFGLELVPFEGVETTKTGALRYGREKQMVHRDIYRFRKV